MNKKYVCCFVLACMLGFVDGNAQATLPAYWNCNDPGQAPTGWTLNQGSSGNFVYTSANLVKSSPASLRLDVTGEWVKINWSGSADTIRYYISGTGASGVTSWKGTFDIEQSDDGVSWTSVKQYIDNMPMGIVQQFAQVKSTARFARFIFTSKVSGYNMALDDITVSPGQGGIMPELQVLFNGKIQPDKSEIKPGNGSQFSIGIKNNSKVSDLAVNKFIFGGANASSFSSKQSLPATIKPGETLGVAIDVNSAGADGSLKSVLEIYSNDSTQLPFRLNMYAIKGNLPTEPTAPAGNLLVSVNAAWKSVVTYSEAPADGYLILLKTSVITESPTDGVVYERGQYLGAARVMQCDKISESVFDNIGASTSYYVKVFAYNGYGNYINYYTGVTADVTYTSPGLQPGNFYGNLNEKDTLLLQKLRSIVRPHFQVYYSNFGSTIATNFESRDTVGGKKIINCFYSGYPYVYTPPFFFDVNDPNYLSREHSYPYSWMGESSQDSANYSDLFMLYPVHQNKSNSVRSNYPMNNLQKVTMQFYGGKFGTDSSGGFAYEPRDFAKGVIARSNFYICATYNRPGAVFTLPTANNFLGTNQDQTVLKRWNKQFLPNAWEVARHEYIASVQKNRNPFVDHPDWACFIDFSKMEYLPGGNCAKQQTSAIPQPEIVSLTVYPNPTNAVFSVDLTSFYPHSTTITLVDFFERTVFERTVFERKDCEFSGPDKMTIIETKSFSAGTYLLMVRSANKQAISKVVIH